MRENVALVTDIADNPMPADEALGLVGLTHAARPLPVAAVGRRAAARGDRARHRQAAGRAAVRRADRRARLRDRQAGARGDRPQSTRELGTTTIVITHNAAIAGMADRVVHLGDGRIQRIERQRRNRVTPAELSLVKALDRKLLRDLSLWSQALTIALVVAPAASAASSPPVASTRWRRRATDSTPTAASPTCSPASSARRTRCPTALRRGARRRRRADARRQGRAVAMAAIRSGS